MPLHGALPGATAQELLGPIPYGTTEGEGTRTSLMAGTSPASRLPWDKDLEGDHYHNCINMHAHQMLLQ